MFCLFSHFFFTIDHLFTQLKSDQLVPNMGVQKKRKERKKEKQIKSKNTWICSQSQTKTLCAPIFNLFWQNEVSFTEVKVRPNLCFWFQGVECAIQSFPWPASFVVEQRQSSDSQQHCFFVIWAVWSSGWGRWRGRRTGQGVSYQCTKNILLSHMNSHHMFQWGEVSWKFGVISKAPKRFCINRNLKIMFSFIANLHSSVQKLLMCTL